MEANVYAQLIFFMIFHLLNNAKIVILLGKKLFFNFIILLAKLASDLIKIIAIHAIPQIEF